ncbi:MAG: B12-binding domain-containing radical SAM protein [Firmicutes bacterium]|nr:B12-binding domain-containing radical SAM protein [Bacillota bacterium]
MRILLTTLNSKYVHSNLALKYLYHAALEELGDTADHSVVLQEFTINNPMEYVYGELVRGDYDLVCFSVYIWNVEKVKALASKLKEACPAVKILMGGPEVSYDTESFLAEEPYVDYVICGEGEGLFRALCRDIAACKSLPETQSVIRKAGDGGFDDWENIPFPYEKLPVEEDKVIYYETSRGCPYRCAYCLSSIDKGIRSMPPDRVKRELSFFIERNVKQVKLIDRTFNYDRERTFEIWRFLIENDNGRTNFHFEICGELLDDGLIELLKTARPGLFQFEVGIQSTCPEALTAVNRRPETDKLFTNIRRVIETGNIHMHVDLIAGLPYEGFQRFGRSFNDVYSLGADNLQLGFLKLLKGTEIRNRAAEGMYRYEKQAPYEIISNRWISAGELVRLKMIENVLDLYDNKGGFCLSLRNIMALTGLDAFGFYMEFSEFFYEEGYQHRSHKKEDLYRILNKFAESKDICIREWLENDLEATMNFDAVKKFYRKGWEI